MASTGDDGSVAQSINSPSEGLSVDAGAENDNDFDLEEAQGDHRNIHPGQPVFGSDRESENEESEDDDRKNRFQGPSPTWRFFTEEERSLAASLDQQRANDLSLHLYNAHAMKARLSGPAAANVEHYRSKKRWIKPDERGDLPWQPPASWTAWPLYPENVPRSGEKFGVPVVPDGLDDATYRKTEPWKSSGHLKEEILAVAMRKAKERLPLENGLNGNTATERRDASPPRRDFKMSGALPADADVSMTDDSDASTDFVTAKFHTRRLGKPPIALHESMLLDDDEARTLLQPEISNVTSQLDELLIGLQKSRRGQVRTNSRSQSRSGRSRSASRPTKSTSRSKSKQLKYQNGSGESSSDAESNDDQPKRRRRLNPRDWSEVLGMATFTGWDPEVVDRAAKRCAALFGERMDFKTISSNLTDSTHIKRRAPGADIEDGKEATTKETSIVKDEPPTNSCVCPIETCAHHAAPFDKVWRWREHLKRSHKYSKARVQKLEAAIVDDQKNAKASARNASRVREARPTTAQAPVDTILRPVKVKMQRGKDKIPRKRKASQAIPMDSDEDASQYQSMQTGSDEDEEMQLEGWTN